MRRSQRRHPLPPPFLLRTHRNPSRHPNTTGFGLILAVLNQIGLHLVGEKFELPCR